MATAKQAFTQATTLDDDEMMDPVQSNATVNLDEANRGSTPAIFSGKRAMLTVHGSDGDGGQEDVFVGINGYAFQIKRDQPVDVPYEVVEVLRNAEVEQMRFGRDGESIESRSHKRFAFSVS